ncbi:MAG: hypothetical protein HXY22_07075 [Alphaproteobacteria bacterium]|nr:hypothetical protein [Alphaproteobacteria bacterium]
MRMWEERQLVRLRDNPGREWVLAALFAGVGACFVALPWVSTDPVEPLMGLAAQIVGFVGLGMSAFVLRRSPRSSVRIDRAARRLWVSRWAPWHRERVSLSFDEISAATLEEERDGDGDPCWRPVLTLKSGAKLPLTLLHRHDERGLEALCRRLNSLIT